MLRGSQSVSLIHRQTVTVIDCQSVETGGSFLLFCLTGSFASDRGSHGGSHLHLNKDCQWLCQSPLSKLPYLMNASTIFFFHPFIQISLKQKWLLFALPNKESTCEKITPEYHFDANYKYELCIVGYIRRVPAYEVHNEKKSLRARPVLIKMWKFLITFARVVPLFLPSIELFVSSGCWVHEQQSYS